MKVSLDENPIVLIMRHPDRLILTYWGPSKNSLQSRYIPWGLIALSLGVCASLAVPAFDFVTRVPGYVQTPILFTGTATAMLAIVIGTGAAFLKSQRKCGIWGACLGFVGLILLPTLARA